MPVNVWVMSIFHLTPSQLRRAAQVKEQIAELQNELIKLSGTVLTKTVTLLYQISFPKFRMTSLVEYHCIIAGRMTRNFCSTLLAGMKRTMEERR